MRCHRHRRTKSTLHPRAIRSRGAPRAVERVHRSHRRHLLAGRRGIGRDSCWACRLVGRLSIHGRFQRRTVRMEEAHKRALARRHGEAHWTAADTLAEDEWASRARRVDLRSARDEELRHQQVAARRGHMQRRLPQEGWPVVRRVHQRVHLLLGQPRLLMADGLQSRRVTAHACVRERHFLQQPLDRCPVHGGRLRIADHHQQQMQHRLSVPTAAMKHHVAQRCDHCPAAGQ
eukprot:5896134-Prymnesium_polylepis.3